jgi:hypothetical protein
MQNRFIAVSFSACSHQLKRALVFPVTAQPLRHRKAAVRARVTFSYEMILPWCGKFGADFAHRVKPARRKPGSHGIWTKCS